MPEINLSSVPQRTFKNLYIDDKPFIVNNWAKKLPENIESNT
jgi:hypothetical protein